MTSSHSSGSSSRGDDDMRGDRFNALMISLVISRVLERFGMFDDEQDTAESADAELPADEHRDGQDVPSQDAEAASETDPMTVTDAELPAYEYHDGQDVGLEDAEADATTLSSVTDDDLPAHEHHDGQDVVLEDAEADATTLSSVIDDDLPAHEHHDGPDVALQDAEAAAPSVTVEGDGCRVVDLQDRVEDLTERISRVEDILSSMLSRLP